MMFTPLLRSRTRKPFTEVKVHALFYSNGLDVQKLHNNTKNPLYSTLIPKAQHQVEENKMKYKTFKEQT